MATITFQLNEVENEKLKKFKRKHHKECNSGVTTMFTESGIGCKVEVYCAVCEKKKDISDYNCW